MPRDNATLDMQNCDYVPHSYVGYYAVPYLAEEELFNLTKLHTTAVGRQL